jgi:hypothetical protein
MFEYGAPLWYIEGVGASTVHIASTHWSLVHVSTIKTSKGYRIEKLRKIKSSLPIPYQLDFIYLFPQVANDGHRRTQSKFIMERDY